MNLDAGACEQGNFVSDNAFSLTRSPPQDHLERGRDDPDAIELNSVHLGDEKNAAAHISILEEALPLPASDIRGQP
ncbi:hypothetical protein D1O30_02490 [Methylocystis hirsuta]|uniref:Uncharacterized protein n=1 Tax=Methylocystis hirsuta TaxID=369798 RepID=A0A3M9XKU7_9HYPH|nr:hypothetical protein D1O30_02490 [Methylocystis hirsuta]